MASRLLTLVTSLALLAGCTSLAKHSDDKPSGREQRLIEQRAVVTGVDQQHRLLALEDDDGEVAVLPVADEFKDFEKLRVGDPVVVSYTAAITWRVKRADEGAPGVAERESLINPREGEAPGGAIEHAITVTATITAVDRARGAVTLAAPGGKSSTLFAQNTADLERVRAGDLVDITYSEVRALAVRPVEKH